MTLTFTTAACMLAGTWGLVGCSDEGGNPSPTPGTPTVRPGETETPSPAPVTDTPAHSTGTPETATPPPMTDTPASPTPTPGTPTQTPPPPTPTPTPTPEVPMDRDLDGYTSDVDCNDASPSIHPNAAESCNGLDDNCDGVVDEGFTLEAFYQDEDKDSYGNSLVEVLACSTPPGYVTDATDCNDADAAIHPGGTERCNALDDNCDGIVDEGVKSTFYLDADSDGYGNSSVVTQACSAPAGYSTNATDCNDSDTAIHPGATEVCNGSDDDCNGQTDDVASLPTWYQDLDSDGYGNAAVTKSACFQPTGYVGDKTDCNDTNAFVYPDAVEQCNAADDNCNGAVDENVVSQTWYQDADADGYGNAAVSTSNCLRPTGYVLDKTDCNDLNSSIHPGLTEVCNAVDDNCDGSVDEGAKSTFYQDSDKDSYGNNAVSVQACSAPSGYVATGNDCNDLNSSIHPGVTETCNLTDDNCDGVVDEGVKSTFYRDADSDGYGNSAVTTQACTAPSGYVTNSTDCNDSSASIHPGATETCNALDDNCNASVDEGVKSTFYQDIDNDGYGNGVVSTQSCTAPSGYVVLGTDCNDSDAAIHPGAAESCNQRDDNCDGSVDEGLSKTTYFQDADGDGYGDLSVSTQACSPVSGYVSNDTDCDDANAAIHPNATEQCNGLDDNCNLQTDEGVGQVVNSGSAVTVNVPTVSIAFNVTLGGQAVSASNTSATDYGALKLRDVITGEIFPIHDFYDTVALTPVGSFSAQVVPGTYDIVYGVVADGANWPDNERAIVRKNVVLTSAQTITLDIPKVAVTFAATLNGAAISATNTSSTDEGSLEAYDPVSGDTFRLWSFYNTTSAAVVPSYTSQLIPGLYDIYYSVVADGPNWPGNSGVLLKRGVSLGSAQSLTYDIQTISLSYALQLNGQPVGSVNTSATDYGDFYLRNTTSQDTFLLGSAFNTTSGQAVATLTNKVIPGTYDIIYTANQDGTRWPSNKKQLLKGAVALTANTTGTLNVQTISFTINSLTLGGAVLSNTNTNTNDYGQLRLQDTTTLEHFGIVNAFDRNANRLTTFPYVAHVMPGTYNLLYAVKQNGPSWPDNERAVLKSGLVLNSNTGQAVDIPYITVTFTVTLNGQAVSSTNTNANDYGSIELYDTSTLDKFPVFSQWNTTTLAVAPKLTTRLLNKTYDVLYSVGVDGPNWPGNGRAILQSGVTFSNNQAVALNVPMSYITVNVTLGGQALSTSNTAALDEGDINLLYSATDDLFQSFSTYNDTGLTVNGSHLVGVIPGGYDVLYSVVDDGPSWPSNTNYLLMCLTAQ